MKNSTKVKLTKALTAFTLALGISALTTATLCGCTEAERATYNVQKQADNFNVTRRLSVINARTDKPLLEIIGNFSISNNENKELVVTVEVEPGVYKVNYVYLNEWTLYTVEDLSGAYVDRYHYEINFLPEMILPVTFKSED